MKLSQLKSKTLTGTTAGALDAAVLAFVTDPAFPERMLVVAQYDLDGGVFSVFILYTD